MSDDMNLGIKIGIDTGDAVTNVKRVENEVEKLIDLEQKPIDLSFIDFKSEADASAKAVGEVTAAEKRLLTQHDALKSQAAARELLNLIPADEMIKRVDAVKTAFQTLKDSGKLSQAELAKASLEMTRQIKTLEEQTYGWKDALMEAKTGLIGVAGAGAGLGYVVKQAVDFESAMADVRKVVDASPEQFARLTERIREMTKELPLTAVELANIAAAGGQLGVAADDLDEFTMLAAKMATAFSMSAGDAGNAIAKLSNVFQIPIAKMGELGDVINVLGNNTNATEAQIVEAMTRIGGSARQFGLAANEAAALTAAFISMGKPPEIAARAISALLSKLQTAEVGSKSFGEGLSILGIQAEDLAKRVQEKPQAALLEFLKTLEKLDNKSRAEALTKLFGQDYQDDLATVTGNLGLYEKLLGQVSDQTAVAGSMQREFAARMATTEAAFKLLKSSLNDIAISIGDGMLPMVKEAAKATKNLSDVFGEFAKLNPGITSLAVTVGVLTASVGTLEVAFKAATLAGLTGFGDIKKMLLSTIKEVGVLRSGILLVDAAIAGVAFGSWLNQFELVRQMGASLVEGLVKGIEYLRTAWEITAAAFTDDTIDAALARHQVRLKQIQKDFYDVHEEIAKGEEKAKKAAAMQDALARSGVDLSKVLTGVSAAAQQATKDFVTITTGFDKAKNGADKFTLVLEDALPKALSKMANGNELKGLQAALDKLYKDRVIDSEQWAQATNKITDAQKALAAPVRESTEEIDKQKKKLEEAEKAARDWQQTLEKSASTLGVGLHEALYGVSQKAVDATTAFVNLVVGFDEAGKKSKEFDQSLVGPPERLSEMAVGVDGVTGHITKFDEELSKGLMSTLKELGSTEDVELFIDNIAELFNQDKISWDQREKYVAAAVGRSSEIINAGFEATRKANEKRVAEAIKGEQDLAQKAQAAYDTELKKQQAIEKTTEALTYEQQQYQALASTVKDVAYNEMAAQLGLKDMSEQSVAAFKAVYQQLSDQAAQNVGTVGQLLESQKALARNAQVAVQNMNAMWTKGTAEVSRLTSALKDGGFQTAENTRAAIKALEVYQYLGDETLVPLRNALEDATRRAKELRAEAENTLASLQDEFDQLNKNYASVEQRRFEAQKADLEAKKADAQKAGDSAAVSDYQKALDLAKKIHDAKLADIKADEESRKKDDDERKRRHDEDRRDTTTAGSTSSSAGGGGVVVRPKTGTDLELEDARKKDDRTQRLQRDDEMRRDNLPARPGAGPTRTVRVEFGSSRVSGMFDDESADELVRMLEGLGSRMIR